MPSNEQRRAAAKRKLERQLENRAQRARKRKQLTIAASALGVVVAVAAGVGIYFLTKGDDNSTSAKASETPDASLTAAPPPVAKAKAAQVNCTYRPSQKPADKPVNAPGTANISTAGEVKATMDTSQGPITMTLNPGESPCTVNSFESLAKQKFFDNTSCHRITTGKGLQVLQCGDPTGSGMGGPGYEFDNEYPTDQYDANDQAAQFPVEYKRGVLAMANAGPGTNGSQFFLVYGDSQLPPQYTIFGTVDSAGLATLDKIAQAGVAGGGQDGKPAADVNIQSVQIN
ncbi:peptidylprolyl isomerase [Nocardia seriolae]|uniref:Peptidyl-prolyl cis-trans isomerase n=1 Tax=Nocardia seriolae TaxID=37332 RepID=A0ABC8AZJ0_9NOCA|nr:peptidylprolyl isomerase [Nocardia seriolae]APA99595.1 Peptidylprolyl isomerase [Nocardia seriolae]MTJ64171.1 peptidylprolyl isomerase [Nocardia seriolae]MTJ73140.1 peptidylprolyl isomerase [Nocardia seriolae]MTJ89165.1 peptidylprolyl isomerase [Nocardia seriolae]MTK33143.1 peptidylprolyl isomerase [Nocardia seriolae]